MSSATTSTFTLFPMSLYLPFVVTPAGQVKWPVSGQNPKSLNNSCGEKYRRRRGTKIAVELGSPSACARRKLSNVTFVCANSVNVVSQRGNTGNSRLVTRSPGGWIQLVRPSWCTLLIIRRFAEPVVDLRTSSKATGPV